ncbi:hypothetical protein KUT70_31925, partial [Pseudomonas aeruginosa]|nr:hypothetical protein [Pseudomonas aeruginosa]
NSTTGYHLRWPKKNSTHCPGWVDHYILGKALLLAQPFKYQSECCAQLHFADPEKGSMKPLRTL